MGRQRDDVAELATDEQVEKLREALQRFGRFDDVTADDVAEADAQSAERKRLLAEGREATVKLGKVTLKLSPRVSVTKAVVRRKNGGHCLLAADSWTDPDVLPVVWPDKPAETIANCVAEATGIMAGLSPYGPKRREIRVDVDGDTLVLGVIVNEKPSVPRGRPAPLPVRQRRGPARLWPRRRERVASSRRVVVATRDGPPRPSAGDDDPLPHDVAPRAWAVAA